MSYADLFHCLNDLCKLGSQGWMSLERVESVVKKIKEYLWLWQEDTTSCKTADASAVVRDDECGPRRRIRTTVKQLMLCIDLTSRSDIRVECGCIAAAILQEIQNQLQMASCESVPNVVMKDNGAGKKGRHKNPFPSAPPSLISVQQTKHESLGVGLRRSLFPEILSAVLELCFCPAEVKSFPDDTAFFREQLETLMTTMNTSLILQHLLLLLGIVKGDMWLGKVCRSLLLRRFLMKPGGVGAVVSAGLAISDKQDWQLHDAIAVLIAQCKIRDVDLFFTTLGPQLLELIEQDSVQPDIFRVVVLIVAKLAERSATLTAIHIINPLLQPLLNTTLPDAPCLCKNSNLTAGVSRIYKIFVEIPSSSTVFTNLLRPVLNPLVMIAALATTYLRTLARQIILRYFSSLPKENVVEGLLVLSGLKICAESPPVNPAIKFSVDDDGGVKINVLVESLHNNNLEDENICTCLISILASLKHSEIVLLFYEKLASCIDFTTLNKNDETPYRTLITNEDVKASQIKTVKHIVICCNLLTHLSENEQLTSDLFMNLSAAVPVIDMLINVGCQKCEEEHLQDIQISLIINVLMLVSCYVSDRTLRKKMTSEDWRGLKSILPSLEKIEQNRRTETVLMFVEQLRSLVLTHGAVNSYPGNIGSAKNSRNVSSDNVKKHFDSSASHNTVVNSQNMKINKDSGINTDSKANNADTFLNLQVNYGNEIDQEINMNCAGKESSYKETMNDLFSPLLPVRGHALLALAKLVEKRDEETLSHKDQLLLIFQHNLKEEDSYLYLMAIEGLAVMCDAFPDKVVKMLTQEFSLGNRCVEDRAKLAEVLTRATRRLGTLLPHYKDFFINSLLNGIRDEEGIVRAASLSGLGDVCKLLHFSLGPVVHEIFGLLYNIVKNDTSVEVRRAAVLVVTLLLQGLGHDAFTVLQVVIRDLYRTLRLIHVTDPDDVVRLHAQLAIAEIDTITREFLLPKLNFTKRIYVTDIPPSAY
ncbi:transport and Golgi organization protein 6 homolog isoform X2 [Procambarus clarkii]|uniref:transport and Golgi organization protein 6 homolog isoform X2 n=1 Tax=Procambarus clarkii TaxID=6728 RepID=UPI001E6760F7|nr:transport and Golgi organization protein 6 homolog isoform X2 [Procambarus clarkii]